MKTVILNNGVEMPEDATSWNRAELQDVPLFKRWHNHVIKKGPEWDHDKFYFNYVLHPYAGAAYFMAARSCGFNFWHSSLYGAIVSTVGWWRMITVCLAHIYWVAYLHSLLIR